MLHSAVHQDELLLYNIKALVTVIPLHAAPRKRGTGLMLLTPQMEI